MGWVRRDVNGNVSEWARNPAPHLGEELPDDHQEVVAYLNPPPPTLDERAVTAIDGKDRLQFEINFDQESRLRVLEGRPAITRAVYRDALIARWKALQT